MLGFSQILLSVSAVALSSAARSPAQWGLALVAALATGLASCLGFGVVVGALIWSLLLMTAASVLVLILSERSRWGLSLGSVSGVLGLSLLLLERIWS